MCLLISGWCTGVILAQDEGPASRLGSVHIGGGGFVSVAPFFGRGDFFRLAPGPFLQDRDLSDHVFRKGDWTGGEGSFDLAMGFYPCLGVDRDGPELRIGVLYGSGPSLKASLTRTVRTPYDTLTSAQTGQRILVDSVHRSEYRLRYSAERLGFNGSLVWRSNGRWSLYGGVGIMGGVLMNARTTVSHEAYAYSDGGTRYPWYSGDHRTGDASRERESFRNGTGWWFGAYIPLGLGWRVATVNTFWRRVHFCYELRPQILVQEVPELPSATGVGIQALFLARVEL